MESQKKPKNEEGEEGESDTCYIYIKHVRICISEFFFRFEIKDYLRNASANKPKTNINMHI